MGRGLAKPKVQRLTNEPMVTTEFCYNLVAAFRDKADGLELELKEAKQEIIRLKTIIENGKSERT